MARCCVTQFGWRPNGCLGPGAIAMFALFEFGGLSNTEVQECVWKCGRPFLPSLPCGIRDAVAQ
eukprot:2897659-Amphidinium_carterae.1